MWDVPLCSPSQSFLWQACFLDSAVPSQMKRPLQPMDFRRFWGDGTILNALLVIMNKVGSAVFDNLPLIFAVGVAIGMAKKEKEVAALSALIAYFVMNVAINGMLVVNDKITADGQIAKSVLEGTVTSVCGIQSLQMGSVWRYYRRPWCCGSAQPFS